MTDLNRQNRHFNDTVLCLKLFDFNICPAVKQKNLWRPVGLGWKMISFYNGNFFMGAFGIVFLNHFFDKFRYWFRGKR